MCFNDYVSVFPPDGPGTPVNFNQFEGNGTPDGVQGFQSAATDFLSPVSMPNMTPPMDNHQSHPLRHADHPVPSPANHGPATPAAQHGPGTPAQNHNPGTPGSTTGNIPPSMTPTSTNNNSSSNISNSSNTNTSNCNTTTSTSVSSNNNSNTSSQPLSHGAVPSPVPNNNQSNNTNADTTNNQNNNQLPQHNDLSNDLNFDPAAIIEGEGQDQEGLDVSVLFIY